MSSRKILQGQHYINGKWLKGEGQSFASVNPMDNQTIWQGNNATESEILEAVKYAETAFKLWSNIKLQERIAYLEKFAEITENSQQELIELISLETGKPLWESKTEVLSVIGKIKISIEAYFERNQVKKFQVADATAHLRFKPHGVTAVLGAFNFPAHLSNGHIIPALLAGNTVIYKPSELSPAVAGLIMKFWHQTGIPKGVISCLQGGGEVGAKLLETDIQGVYFTGSYKIGQMISKHFADKPHIILALEMGGSNPLVVDKVNNIEAAIYCTILSSLLTAGQRCSCARRLIIKNDSQGDKFLASLIQACKNLKVGAFREKPEPFMGPVIRHQHALMHLKAQENLLNLGAKSLLRMSLIQENSALLSPGLLDMTGIDQAPDEEVFAPLIQIYRYQNFEEAIAIANNTRYGLTAGLIADDLFLYEKFYQEVKAGIINWNRPTTGALSSLPFGGIGFSGNHRPSAYFAADYCAYPVSSMEQAELTCPDNFLPGINLG